MEKDRNYLLLLLLISLLLSLYLYFRTYVIALDGAFQYIPLAKLFASGSLHEALRTTGQQPLYPLLISLFSKWIPDMEIAGKLVASLSGMLLIFPIYFLGKRMVGAKIAFLATLLLILHPYLRRFSADVLKESTYLLFLALVLWFTWKTLQENEKYSYLLIPFLSLLAYLVRPDGMEILLVVFVYILSIKPFQRTKERWTALLLFWISSLLLALPYLLYLKEITGIWTLSKTKAFSNLLGMGSHGDTVPLMDKIEFAFKEVHLKILSTFHPLFLLLMVVGGFKRKWNHLREGDGFLLLFFVLHYVILFLLALNATEWEGEETVLAFQLSGRHVLPLLLFSITWIGVGFQTVSDWVSHKMESMQSFSSWSPRKREVFLLTILILLAAIILLPKTLKPQRYERLPEKKAGTWMKAQWGSGLHILTTLPRVAFYADGTFERIDFSKGKTDHLPAFMAERKILYLVLREKDRSLPEVEKLLEKHFKLIQRFGGEKMEGVLIYRIESP